MKLIKDICSFAALPYLCLLKGIPRGSGIGAALGQLAIIGGIAISLVLQALSLAICFGVLYWIFG